jgi:hypothetical protein
MVAPNAQLSSPLERVIAVVAGFINDVDQWRCQAILTRCIRTVASSTLGLISKLPDLGVL